MKLTSMLTNCMCQSCYKILRNTDEFNEHIKRVHSRSDPSLHSSVESSSLASNNYIKKIQYARRRRRKIGVDLTNTDKANWKWLVKESPRFSIIRL